MTDKHTPGPWVVLNAGATVSRYGYADSAETIADVRHKPDGESAANAALIAAAPELLEALRGMIDYAASEIGIEPEEAVGGHFKAARAAIAKAESRS